MEHYADPAGRVRTSSPPMERPRASGKCGACALRTSATRRNTETGNEPNKLAWQVAEIDCPKPQMLAVHPDGMVPM